MARLYLSPFAWMFGAILLLLIPALACGSASTSQQLSDAARQGANATDATPTANEQNQATQSSAQVPVQQVQPLKLISTGFGQDGRRVGYAFIVENLNSNLALENNQYQVTAYNADGAVLEVDSGYVALLLPAQRLGVAGEMIVDEGIIVSKVEVQLSDGSSVRSENIPTFTVGPVTYWVSTFFNYAAAELTSPYDIDITNLRVSAVAYNAGGQIIGGGFTYVNFVLANGKTGVKVSLVSSPDVAVIELYPTISGLSALDSTANLPLETSKLNLVKVGFGQDDNRASFGMLINNANAEYSIENSQYRVVAYDTNGTLLNAEEGYIQVLTPGATLGAAGDLFVPENQIIARVDIQLKDGRYEKTGVVPSFTSENITFLPSDFFDKVTGTIVSPYAKEITNIRVSALSYDQAGQIIGGGFTYIDFVPANGRAAADVSVTVSGQSISNELYASVSGLSDFK